MMNQKLVRGILVLTAGLMVGCGTAPTQPIANQAAPQGASPVTLAPDEEIVSENGVLPQEQAAPAGTYSIQQHRPRFRFLACRKIVVPAHVVLSPFRHVIAAKVILVCKRVRIRVRVREHEREHHDVDMHRSY
jgi:hypothetical protein